MNRFQLGDSVELYVNGRGRGGHIRAYCVVTKVNRKTIDVTEAKGSYCSGKVWRVHHTYESIWPSKHKQVLE